jgi:type 1 glutamine amidotransferase
MSLIRYDAALNVLVVTRGHPFERDPFFAVFESFDDMACSAVEQPAAQVFFTPERARAYDAFVHYDMPGIRFGPDGPDPVEPPCEYVEGFLALLRAGHGFVFLHHAIAGWPSWEAYADIVGARFLYAPANVYGRHWPDSGYRHHVRHRVSVATRGHPVVEGLEDGFEIEDELYLCPVLEDRVLPLLRSDHAFVDSGFYSSAQAVRGRMFSKEGWSHPPGSSLIAWAHRYGSSPIVTILCGDDASAYANPSFRRLVGNAIRWVANPAARKWASEGSAPTRTEL